MLLRGALRGVGSVLGLLINGNVELAARPAFDSPLAVLTTSCDSFALTISDARRGLPLESLTLEGQHVKLGWRWPALAFAPFWFVFAPHLLPLLTTVWLLAPGAPKAGTLEFDAVVREGDFARGAWPAVLSAVLSMITRASLPALLMDVAEQGGSAPLPGLSSSVPSSQCTAASVVGTKLVLDGQVRVRGSDGSEAPLEYTLRTGVKARRSALGLDGSPLAAAQSTLCWEDPELRLSLGDTGLVGMLPKMWVPIQSATGVQLPPWVLLRRAAVSEAIGGFVANGVILLDGKQPSSAEADADEPGPEDGRGGEPGAGGQLRLRPAV